MTGWNLREGSDFGRMKGWRPSIGDSLILGTEMEMHVQSAKGLSGAKYRLTFLPTRRHYQSSLAANTTICYWPMCLCQNPPRSCQLPAF